MPQKSIKILLVVAIFIVTAIYFIKNNSYYIALVDPDTNKKYASFQVTLNELFSVEFIHSVNKSSVREYYKVNNKMEIVLVESVYYGFGAGVQTELNDGETLTYGKDGSMHIQNINKIMPNLIYRVGTISDHILHINGKSFSLTNLCGKNSKVKFIVS